MAKFYGKIGYAETIEMSPGVWEPRIIEKVYSGDIIRNSRRWQAGESVNDDLVLDNQFSIIADSFAYENFYKMKYIHWMGAFWKITKVDIQRPRLILSVGGVYNGETASTSISS